MTDEETLQDLRDALDSSPKTREFVVRRERLAGLLQAYDKLKAENERLKFHPEDGYEMKPPPTLEELSDKHYTDALSELSSTNAHRKSDIAVLMSRKSRRIASLEAQLQGKESGVERDREEVLAVNRDPYGNTYR